MDGVVVALVNMLAGSGNSAIVTLMLFVSYCLWAERIRLLAENAESQKRLDLVAQAQTESTRAIVTSIEGVRAEMRDIAVGRQVAPVRPTAIP